MEVRNCRQCGRLYNYIGGSYKNLCPDCIKKVEEKFTEVKSFIEENRVATMSEVSEKCGVSVKQIEQWVRDERLCFSDDSPIGIACERCGAMIKSGRFCESCKALMTNQLNSLYSEKKSNTVPKRRTSESSRMRYFDKF